MSGSDEQNPFKDGFLERVVEVHWGVQPKDLIIFGDNNRFFPGTGTLAQPHLWLGVRKGKPVIIRSGSFFGDTPPIVDHINTPPNVTYPAEPVQEFVDDNGTQGTNGIASIGGFHVDTDETIDVTGGRGEAFFTKNKDTTLFQQLYVVTGKGEFFVPANVSAITGTAQTFLLFNKKGKQTGVVNLRIDDGYQTLPTAGAPGLFKTYQFHNVGMIEGGGDSFFVAVDYPGPEDTATYTFPTGSFTLGSGTYKGGQRYYIKIFDWTGKAVGQVYWGKLSATHEIIYTDGTGAQGSQITQWAIPAGPFPSSLFTPAAWPPSVESSFRNSGMLQVFPSDDDKKLDGTPV